MTDTGGSLLVHCFGAYFGMAVARGISVKPRDIPEAHRESSYFSDMGCMVGTVVLWVFWPSFNGQFSIS